MMNSGQSSSRPWRPSALIAAILGFLGFVDAAYLAADHFFTLPLPCSVTGGCDLVLSSPYATIGPIPIALIGTVYYLAVFVLALTLFTAKSPKRGVAQALAALTGTALVVSLVLVYLQLFVIRAICAYCIGSAVLTLLLFVTSVSLFRHIRRAPEATLSSSG